NDGTNGTELWRSDGTPGGTVLVKDINPGAASSIYITSVYDQSAFVNVAGTLFLFADDGIHGRELWKSDGTDAGTVLVADITPGAASTHFEDLPASANGNLPATANGKLFFLLEGTGGTELWMSDGTAAGTMRVPGSYS